MLPDGSDTVIRIEDALEENGRVRILTERKIGQDIRYKGEEFRQRDLLLPSGVRISAPQAALLASVGITRLEAYKQCKIDILVTGSELVGAGDKIAEHQIRDSNTILLKGAISAIGAQVRRCLRVDDNQQAIEDALSEADADIILCTGGISVGRHDHVKAAAEAQGFTPLFWKIRQKPGKPLYFAQKGKLLLFGMPGNPMSAYMCFAHYVRPVITALHGAAFELPTLTAMAQCELANHGSRAYMILVRLIRELNGCYQIKDVGMQGSHMLFPLAKADGYVILDPGHILRKGELITVYGLDPRRGVQQDK